MHPRKLPQFVEDLLYAEEHRLLDDDVGQAMKSVVSWGIADPFVRSFVEERVQLHAISQAFAGPFPLPHLSEGDVVAGFDLRGRPIRFPLQYLNAHSLTVGGSGCGKTTRQRFLLLQIASRVKGNWWFDFRKREFAILESYLARLGISLSIVPARTLRLNPLQLPSAVLPADWASRVADMLVHVLDLPPRATKLLQLAVLELYRVFGVAEGKGHFPTLFDLREAVAAKHDANPQARQAVIDSLDPVLMSLGPVLAYRVAWKTEDLARHHVVFQLDGATEVEKDLILNSLVLPEFTSRVARGISNPRMDLFICCDEALRLVAADSPRSSMADLLGLIRGTGVGLDLSVQTANVMPSVLSNTASKWIGRCGSAADYETVSNAMGLTADQRRWMCLNLQPGLFVGQLGEGEWRQPFVVRVPPLQLVVQQPRRSSGGLEQLVALPTVAASEFANWHPDRGRHDIRSTGSMASSTDSPDRLSDAARRFLEVVVLHPGRPSSEYARLARVSSQRAVSIRRDLVDRGWVREHSVVLNQRGRPAIVLEPTPAGIEAVQRSDRNEERQGS